MKKKTLKGITVYLTTEEYNQLKHAAEISNLTVSAKIRFLLGLPVLKPGAPANNQNRSKRL
jgi:hypothetical protein